MSILDTPWAASITDLAPAIETGKLSPVELLESYLERIDRFDDEIGAYVHLNNESLKTAEQAHKDIRSGRYRGPLHGIPIAVKDNYTTRDMPTGAGTRLTTSYAMSDATAVKRLRDAGAVLFGKTRMHEFAWGMETPPTRNPRAMDCVPGGSSGGSGAAVAAGLAAAALGSDTGGSIRIPASVCGCVGLKPTFGLIGRSGIVPHSWSLDHAGPLAASVADAACVTRAMAGFDKQDPASQATDAPEWSDALSGNVTGLRVGVCRNHFFQGVLPEVLSAVEDSIDHLAKAGAIICEFEVPDLAYGLGAIFAIELASSTNYHDQRLRSDEVEQLAPDVRMLVEMGRLVSAPDYLQAERYRQRLGLQFADIFDNVDVIISPTLPLTAWPVGEREVSIDGNKESVLAVSWRLTYPWNLLGLPAISLPCGTDKRGLPIGLQIAGPAFGEAAVLRSAAFAERSAGGPMARHDPITRQGT
ncbi:MAG: amidase [Granulosicoccus sp.]